MLKKVLLFTLIVTGQVLGPLAAAAEPLPPRMDPSFRVALTQPATFSQAMSALSDFFLRLGNLRQNEQVFSAIQKVSQQALQQGKITANEAQLLDLLLSKTRILGGRYNLARQEGAQLLALAQQQPNPEELLEAYACLLWAAHKGGLPELTQKYLGSFEAALQQAPPEQLPTWKFLHLSFQELQALEKAPSSGVEDFCSRHDACWKLLQGLVHSTRRAITGRIVAEVGRSWLQELAAHYRDHKVVVDSPQDKRMGDSLELAAGLLSRQGEIVPPGELHDFEVLTWAFGLVGYLTDLHRLVRQLDIPGSQDVLQAINGIDSLFAQQEPELLQVEKGIQQQMPGELLQALPAGFRISVTSGDWSLARMRIRQAQLLDLAGPYFQQTLKPAQLKQARKLSSEALAFNAKALTGVGYQGYEDPRWSSLGLLLSQRPSGWQGEAEKLLGQLRQTNASLGNREGQVLALTLTAELQLAQRQKQGALASLQGAVALVESYVQEAGMSPLGAERLRGKYQRAYQLLAQLQIEQGQLEKAWHTLNCQHELELAQTQQASLRQSNKVREVQKVRGELAMLEQQLVQERALGQDSQATEQLLAQNKGDYQRVVADLRRSHPQHEAAMAVRPVEFLELKKSIPSDTTAVLYFMAEDGVYLFVASRDSDLKIRKVSVKPKELERCVFKVRSLINDFPLEPAFAGHPEAFHWSDPKSPGYQRHTLPLKQELSQLHRWLIAPIEGDLGNRPVLALVPSGLLHFVPFPALCHNDTSGEPRFLAQDRQCVNLVKTSDLIPRGGERGQVLCAFGNPDGSLPGAEREVKSIAQSFPEARQYLGAEANAARLRQLEPNTGYVHLATHGEISSTDPKNSYLVLAQEKRLRATDIYDLDWQGVRLVTLSACKTALQEGSPGAAITNLAEAFRVAGGQSVVASLWSVGDQATEALMVEFYQGLAERLSLGAALQRAEVKMSQRPGLKHPYYWAAFALFGDWR